MEDLFRHLYGCDEKENNCPKRNNCKRFFERNNVLSTATLFKSSCTESNNRILFIEKEDDIKEQ